MRKITPVDERFGAWRQWKGHRRSFRVASAAEHSNIAGLAGKAALYLVFNLAVLIAALSLNSKTHANTQGSLTVDGRKRTYELHVPASYNSGQPSALVLALHGLLGTGHKTAEFTHFDKVSDAHGFLTVYPDGLHRSWADGRGATDSDKEGIDDVKFISELIRNLSSHYRIDASRVYAAGISNGGFMSQHIACALADQVAAVGVIAATMGERTANACRPAGPVSVIVFQGDKDPLVPIQGGPMGPNGSHGTILSLQDTAGKWAGLNGCDSTPQSSALPDKAGDGTIVRKQTYAPCKENSEVVIYTIEGGGHTWPGGKQYLPEMFVGKTTRNLDASESLWEFFSRHTR